MEYGILGLIILIANIYAIYQVITSGASGLAKIIWTVAILVLPVLGLIAWLIAGPRGGTVRV
ncbi:hypothetical protein Z946_2199 [Sulfitobacter noctilucicola]|uniref:Phage-related minor tail protein n=1 Tax=Sulfitobacter noctilucicola TaxID=1342301 RepID=A0A7W6M9X3_9RHOB|nr:PLDc N-terminal domain-containing protein [Sulfitobacter noctilucicola]KIN63329.1 hypothetical protein Z946_2199 [Sulfitobacter noctilucicola]MBB4175153.1 phage-related minor tail protein [Sulfitobacter noctilucicola]